MKKVPINRLRPNPWNPNRMDKETFESLKESIRSSNLLEENPIVVRPKGDGGYEIVDGEERWRAARELGHKEIPVKEEELDDLEAKRRTVILNKDRGRIDYFLLGKIFWELSRKGGGTLTEREIGKKFGYSQPEVSMIANVYSRLKGFKSKQISMLSNWDKKEIAMVLNDKFRKILFDARVKGEIESIRVAKKVALLNELWEYIKEKGGYEEVDGGGKWKVGEALIRKIMDKLEPDLLKASISTLKNTVDVELEKLVERNIIHGDALVEMPKLEEGSFDCVIADPPYLVSELGGDIKFKSRKDIKRDLAVWDHADREEFLQWCKRWIKQAYRVLKEGGTIYIFTSDRLISYLIDILEEVGFTPKTTVVWHKTNPAPSVRKRDYCSSTEYIVFAVKGEGYTFNWLGQEEMHNFYECPICMGDERTVHPTQKPVALIRHLLRVSTDVGDKVLDPFAGSGTTAVACEKEKRHWTVIEKEKEYVDIIKRRVGQWSKLFMSPAGRTSTG